MYKVVFYKDGNGNEPLKGYIYGLAESGRTNKNDRVQFQKIMAYIKALETYGTRIGAPTVKHIDGSIWELRPLENRIFFFYWKDNKFVLLHHYIKKSQKAPLREIEQARRNMADFIKRSEEQ